MRAYVLNARSRRTYATAYYTFETLSQGILVHNQVSRRPRQAMSDVRYTLGMKYAILALGAFILLLMVNAFLGGNPLG